MFCLQAVLFIFVANHRFIDGDEGYFLLAARLVLLHKKPYIDFFFQQTPLLPYVYALWLKCFGVTWTSARILPALLSALLGTILYRHICGEMKSWAAGIAGVFLYCTSTLIFAWLPIAKPYSLAGLFIFSAYVTISALKPERHSPWMLSLAGLLLGLAGDTRSYVAITIPLFLVWIYRNSELSLRRNSIFYFIGGFLGSLIPCFYFFLSSPKTFVFDNLGYHAIRTDAGLVGNWGQKLVIVLMSFLGGPEGNGLQNSLLLVVSLGFVFSIHKSGWAPKLALQLAMALGLISLLPTPVLPQYFCFCIPFLIVSSICVATEVVRNLESPQQSLLAAGGCVLLLAIYAAVAPPDFRKYLVTGDGIPAVRGAFDREDWRLSKILEVSEAIDKLAAPNEAVASFWPGYLFQTQARPFPGLETDCGLAIAGKLTPEEMAQYHIVSWSQMGSTFASHSPRIVVVPNHQRYLGGEVVGDRAKTSLLASDYSLATIIGDTSIYICCSAH
jgi:4-amino-4-deoxy-L-arabinose transferase-like glycosyltransferase